MNRILHREAPYDIEVIKDEGYIVLRDAQSKRAYKLDVLSGIDIKTNVSGLETIAKQMQDLTHQQKKDFLKRIEGGIFLLEINQDEKGNVEFNYGGKYEKDFTDEKGAEGSLLTKPSSDLDTLIKRAETATSSLPFRARLEQELVTAKASIRWEKRVIVHVEPFKEKESLSIGSILSSIARTIAKPFQKLSYFFTTRKFFSDILKDPWGVALRSADPRLQNDPDSILAAMRAAGKNKFLAFQYASPELRKDPAFICKVVAIDGLALQYADPQLQKEPGTVRIAVSQNGHALQYADPELKKDPGIVELAVAQSGGAIVHADPSLKTNAALLKIAVANNPAALDWADPELKKDREFVKEIVGVNGLALAYVDPSLRTDPEIVHIAVKQNGLALGCIPRILIKKLENPQDIAAFLRFADAWRLEQRMEPEIRPLTPRDYVKPEMLNQIPANIWSSLASNPERIKTWIQEHPEFAKADLPKERQITERSKTILEDPEFVQALLEAHPEFEAPNPLNDPEIIKAAIENDPLALEFASEALQDDKEIVQLAVAKNGLALKFASQRLRNDPATVIIAVQDNPDALEFGTLERGDNGPVGTRNDLDVVAVAVAKDPAAIRHASFTGIRDNPEFMIPLLEKDGLLLRYAPALQTHRESALAAVTQNPKAFAYVQDNSGYGEFIDVLIEDPPNLPAPESQEGVGIDFFSNVFEEDILPLGQAPQREVEKPAEAPKPEAPQPKTRKVYVPNPNLRKDPDILKASRKKIT